MPLYDYHCSSCKEKIEGLYVKKFEDGEIQPCPHCGFEYLTKVIAPTYILTEHETFSNREKGMAKDIKEAKKLEHTIWRKGKKLPKEDKINMVKAIKRLKGPKK
jgi:putative FmdB family regulatory protein